MPEVIQAKEVPVNDAIEAPPTWEELRESGRLIVDLEDSKLAVYTGDLGSVVLASQEYEDANPRFIVLDPDCVPALVAALHKARVEASALAAQWDAKYEAAEMAHAEAGGAASA
ncbi:hypothetical protein LJR074_003495 [Acidovorax sp. LjRoot74]|uniref:hypothetical protein n=1 Tax=Acidovorax sp. LjRoot74 TaxID=3342337 RepID=UPI003ECDF17F